LTISPRTISPASVASSAAVRRISIGDVVCQIGPPLVGCTNACACNVCPASDAAAPAGSSARNSTEGYCSRAGSS
jgi:hypothetical protein